MDRRVFGWCSILACAILLVDRAPAEAQLAGRPAEEWIRTLESPARVASLKVPEVVKALNLKPGQTVADIGAGTGIFTMPMALAVRPRGEVYAVDIVPELVEHILEKATETGIANVRGAVGTADDPNMPGNVDLALIVDVLHHIEKRAEYLKNLAAYLNPGGRIAIVEFKPDQSPHRSDAALVVSEEQTAQWLAAAGLKPVERIDLFTDKWFVIYALSAQ